MSGVVGGSLFLEAIGFHQQLLPHQGELGSIGG